MTPGKNSGASPKPSFKSTLVKFTASEADQLLRQAIEQRLAAAEISFSDLCKAALRLMLLPEAELAPPRSAPAALPEVNLAELAQQVQQLAERLTAVEQQLEQQRSEAPAELPPPEIDPLLSRLAPLLEDF